MSLKELNIDLENPSSLKNLKRIFHLMESNFEWLNKQFLKFSLEYLEERAKLYIDTTTKMQTGDLKSSFKKIIYKDSGELINNSLHAIFVEFGTGIKGKNSQHPNSNGFSFRETGWTYKSKDGNYYHTNGQVAHKFMYNAFNDYYYRGGYIECFVKAFDVFMDKKVNKGRKYQI